MRPIYETILGGVLVFSMIGLLGWAALIVVRTPQFHAFLTGADPQGQGITSQERQF